MRMKLSDHATNAAFSPLTLAVVACASPACRAYGVGFSRYGERVITRAKRLLAPLSTLLLAVVLSTGLAACAPGLPAADGEAPAPSATPASDSETLALLFMLDAEAGTLTHVDGANYVLELTTAGERMIWFSDRPDQKSGSLGTDEFITTWPAFGFDESPPNIGFTANGTADGVSIVATMTEPSYDTATAVFTANLEILFASPNHALEQGRDTAYTAEQLPTTLTDIAMFIDDAALTTTTETCVTDANGLTKCDLIYSQTFIPFDSSF